MLPKGHMANMLGAQGFRKGVLHSGTAGKGRENLILEVNSTSDILSIREIILREISDCADSRWRWLGQCCWLVTVLPDARLLLLLRSVQRCGIWDYLAAVCSHGLAQLLL